MLIRQKLTDNIMANRQRYIYRHDNNAYQVEGMQHKIHSIPRINDGARRRLAYLVFLSRCLSFREFKIE